LVAAVALLLFKLQMLLQLNQVVLVVVDQDIKIALVEHLLAVLVLLDRVTLVVTE
jgi:hypothetical protein